MQKESVKYFSAKRIISYLMILILIPATLILFWHFGDRKYYLCSLLLIIYSMIPFFLSFEKRKPQARELVSIAVMCAIAVVSRAAFMMLPHFKPMLGIIMITGMAFGAEAGFLTGALGAFVSNFLFGQGPWTPWQMFGYGIGGLLAGLLARKGIMTEKKRVWRSCLSIGDRSSDRFSDHSLHCGTDSGYLHRIHHEQCDHGGIRRGDLSVRTSGKHCPRDSDSTDSFNLMQTTYGEAGAYPYQIWNDG